MCDFMANQKKTKVMTFNRPKQPEIRTNDGSKLELVDDFTYLGSQINSTIADAKKRIGFAWTACNSLSYQETSK